MGGFYSVFDSERFILLSEGSFLKPKLWLRSCALLSRPSLSATFSATCFTSESNVVLLGSIILNLDGTERLPDDKIEVVL